jgi:NADH-quinone oxidoreductase subunit G
MSANNHTVTQAATLTINGRPVEINGEKNLLEVVRKAGIDLPTFCYHSELSAFGACRQCLVETEDGRILASCSTPAAAGMKVRTHTPRVQKIRKVALELLLANHDRECTTCEKSGVCKLQDLAQRYNINEVRFGKRDQKIPLDLSSPAIVRNPNRCILCGDCVRMCKEVQGLGILDFANRGSNMVVTPAFGREIADVECVNCGQCAAVCPTGALTVKSEVDQAWAAIHDKSKTVVVQIAPAVRVAVGDAFGLKPGEISLGKLVTALRLIGVDRVFDTSFAADLTVMEETTEFLNRLKSGEHMPQFTSCCPAWVKYAEQYYPDMLSNLSSCRSPQQMFGSIAKRYYTKEMNIEPKDMYVISIMPCTAKKFEAARPEFANDGVRDVDLVLTTQEIAHMIKEAGINFADIDEDSLDMPFGFTTGAGVIFGVTGGVAEAVLRASNFLLTGEELQKVAFTEVRGLEGTRGATVDVAGHEVRVAVTHTLSEIKTLIEKIRSGEEYFDIIEVMACPGGCIGGAGQPGQNTVELRKKRSEGIYRADTRMQLRKAQENPLVQHVYDKWLGNYGSHEAHETLHTQYTGRSRMPGDGISIMQGQSKGEKVDVAVCVGTCCFLKGSTQMLADLTELIDQSGYADQVNLRAAFCLENCAGSASVKVDDKVIGGLTSKKSAVVMQEIMSALRNKKAKVEA